MGATLARLRLLQLMVLRVLVVLLGMLQFGQLLVNRASLVSGDGIVRRLLLL